MSPSAAPLVSTKVRGARQRREAAPDAAAAKRARDVAPGASAAKRARAAKEQEQRVPRPAKRGPLTEEPADGRPPDAATEPAGRRPRLGAAEGEATRRRPRRAPPEPLRDSILGYIEDDSADPPRSGTTKYRQSKEITELVKADQNIPIAKELRADYVWVAAVRLPDGRKKYTWDAEVMTPLGHFEIEDDNTCDVCGACCVEVLYEFRCYRRLPKGASRPAQDGERCLEPAVAYISKECGRGLLGVQSEASKLRERLYTVISAEPEQAVETLRELWRVSNKAQQRVITDELRHFAGIEIGESDKVAELRNAEATFGQLRKSADDVFRAAARLLGATLKSRDLAAVAVLKAEREGVQLKGFFARVATALKEKQPLPMADSPWAKDDVRETLTHLVRAWPLRVELLDSLSKPEMFGAADADSDVPTLRFMYLHGSGELHVPVNSEVGRPEALKLRGLVGDLLLQTKAEFKLSEGSGLRRTHKKQEDDDLVLPEGEISQECVRAALDKITWPDCTTRTNVVPEGAAVISAFPLGIVNNYAMGMMCSRATTIRPKLSQLLTRFLAARDPNFRYTTIQLNRNYAARMHVDGNNDGPSYIIGIGEYTGGELWIYDEQNGDYEMELKEPMRGYPHLKIGSKLKGRVVDIKHKWFAFNGTVPHSALPFRGCRMSIVYFSRKKWQTISEDVMQQLMGLSFPVPRDSLPAIPGTKEQLTKVGLKPAIREEEEEPEEEEVDEVSSEGSSGEEEELVRAAHGWAERFLVHLGCPGGNSSRARRSVALLSCQAGLGVPALALKELLPERASRVLCIAEPEEAALRFARLNCTPEVAFRELADVARGTGHCEVRHRNTKLPTPNAGDISVLAGALHISSFVGLDTRVARAAAARAPMAEGLQQLRRCLASLQPCVAILEVRGLSETPPAQRDGALRCLLDGVELGGGADADAAIVGLRQMGGYGVELLQLNAAEFGVPLAEVFTFALLLRQDSGGQAAAERAASLARALRGLLPRASAGELLLENSSSRLLQVVKAEWKKADKAIETGESKMRLQRTFTLEAKELGIEPGQAPYSQHLREELGVRECEWFPHASAEQKAYLNLVYMQALKAGADMDSLIVDMWQGVQTQPWRDDGLLPSTTTGGALLYSFCRHRPLLGAEALACRGLPVPASDARGMGDLQTARLASSAVPLPVYGAVLCGALAAAEQGGQQVLVASRAIELAASAPARAGELSVMAIAAQPSAEEPSEEVQFGGRAAVLLNLLRNGARRSPQEQGSSEPAAQQAPNEAARLLHSSLARVTRTEEEESGGEVEASVAGAGQATGSPDETKEWPGRLSSLRAGRLGFQANSPSCGAAMRWVREAAEDPQAELATDIIEVGTSFICAALAKERRVPEAAAQQRLELLGALRDVEREAEASRVAEALTTVRFLQELDESSKRLAIKEQAAEHLPKYINGILGKVSAWPMRRGYLDHVVKAVRGGWAPETFAKHGGLVVLARWISEAPQGFDKDWPGAVEALGMLASVALASDTTEALLRMLHATLARLEPRAAAALSPKVEASMVQVVVGKMKDMTTKQGIPKILQEWAELPGGEPSQRFSLTLKLVRRVRTELETARDETKRSSPDWNKARATFRKWTGELLTEKSKVGRWKPLAQLEERMVQGVEASLKALEEKAVELESANKAMKEKEKQDHFESQVTALGAKVDSEGHLHDATTAGLEAVVADLQAVRRLVRSGLSSSRAVTVLRSGEFACRSYCERKERRQRQKRWLQQQGFGSCFDLLEAQGLLEGLGALSSECLGGQALPERWRRARLPVRVSKGLLAAALSGKLRKTMFDILDNEVPQGWSREFSQSAGLHYFVRMYGEGRQWEWPSEDDPPEAATEPPEPRHLKHPGWPRKGAAVYIQDGETSEALCTLCDEEGEEHLRSEEHKSAAREWGRLADALQGLRLEFVSQFEAAGTTSDPHAPSPGLVRAWTAELVLGLEAVKAPEVIFQTFWHGVVKPTLPAQSTAAALLEALSKMLRLARAGEDDGEEEGTTAEPVGPKACEAVAMGKEMLSKLGPDHRIASAAACQKFVALMTTLRAALDGCGRARPAEAVAALRTMRAAIVKCNERPAHRKRAVEWLRRHSLGHCAQPLAEAQLLDRLLDLASTPKLADGLGLPRRCVEVLSAALEDGRLTAEDLTPGALPAGWESKASNSTGLRYYVHTSGKQQWEWPDPGSLREEVPAEPPLPSSACKGTGGEAMDSSAYLVLGADGIPRCLLCAAPAHARLGHEGSTVHRERAARWDKLAARFAGPAAELKQLVPDLKGAQPGRLKILQATWRGEFHTAVCGGTAAELVSVVEAVFWHRVAKPQLKQLEGMR